jgi:hypothetical protein
MGGGGGGGPPKKLRIGCARARGHRRSPRLGVALALGHSLRARVCAGSTGHSSDSRGGSRLWPLPLLLSPPLLPAPVPRIHPSLPPTPCPPHEAAQSMGEPNSTHAPGGTSSRGCVSSGKGAPHPLQLPVKPRARADELAAPPPSPPAPAAVPGASAALGCPPAAPSAPSPLAIAPLLPGPTASPARPMRCRCGAGPLPPPPWPPQGFQTTGPAPEAM